MERMRVISAEPPLSGRERLPRYDLFQRKDKPDLHCAVPKERPVPTFLRGSVWRHVGTIPAGAAALPGFQADQAREGVGLNGFYLFMAHRTGSQARGSLSRVGASCRLR